MMNELNMLIRPFTPSVSVIVPIYNAPLSLKNLITSLASSVPQPLPGLTFQFLDDGSPDPAIRSLFTDPFFTRTDVQVETRAENRGFIFTVNEGILKAPADADIVILNSDTEVWTELFSTLQAEAHSDSQIASVTPLTNNGTIASLFSFPSGAELPAGLSARQIAETVAKLQIPSPRVPIPTGVGFCMYLKRTALQAIGLLDPIYGKGYGEECDWSRKAVSQGWSHLISTRAFVYHSGTQSFPSETKKLAIQQNSRILNQRYPEYDVEVATYVRKDPLWLARLEISLALLTEDRKNRTPSPPTDLVITPETSLLLQINHLAQERDQLLNQLAQIGGSESFLFNVMKKVMKVMAKFKASMDRLPFLKSLLRAIVYSASGKA